MGRVAQPISLAFGEGMVARRVLMPARHVVFFKGIIEASDGVAGVFAERGGDVAVVAPADRVAELDLLLSQLRQELEMIEAPTSAQAEFLSPAPRARGR
jgi:hypothetical protein